MFVKYISQVIGHELATAQKDQDAARGPNSRQWPDHMRRVTQQRTQENQQTTIFNKRKTNKTNRRSIFHYNLHMPIQ